MNRRKIEILIAVLILLGLIGLVVFILLRREPQETTPSETDPEIIEELPPLNEAEVPAPMAVSAQTASRVFVERFGSYSSESDFANIEDVLTLATPGFRTQLENLLASERARAMGETYYGVSTYVISSNITAESEATMTFMVTTQRREAVGTPGNTTVRYQDIEVKLEKISDDWMIAGYTWQD